MPLTRHLYREDEVEAALMLACLRGRTREAAFWCLELLDSGLTTQLLRGLRTIWLLGWGRRALGWWRAFEAAAGSEELEEQAFLDLAVGLARLGSARDSTVVALLGVAHDPTIIPDRVGYCIGPGLASASTELERYVIAAGLQGRIVATWLGLRATSTEALALASRILSFKHGSIGQEVAATLEASVELTDPQKLALAAATVCLSTAELKRGWEWVPLPQPIPVEVAEAVAEWRGATGRRGRRAITMPLDALYWLTARGSTPLTVYDTTEKELLRWRFGRPQALWGSEYWDGVAEEFGGWEAIAAGEEAQEAFWDREFPDDIPDEWSKADRVKSHGCGVLQRGGVATVAEWLRRWFGPVPCGVWRGIERAVTATAGAAANSIEELWTAAAEPVPAEAVARWNLRPVRRVVEAATAS